MPTGVSRAAEPEFDIDIPAMNAAEALNRLAEQTGSVMLFSYDLARAREANAVRGRYTLLEGLGLLLRDTGLSGGLSDKRVVIIAEEGNMPAGKGESVKKRGLLASIFAVLAASAATNVKADQESNSAKFEEIIVTASKRPEPLREVANSVTAFSGDELSQIGAQSFEDYLGRAPGVIYDKVLPGQSSVVIRGVGTTTAGLDQGQGTTGIYLNGVPLTDPSYAVSIPDIDTFDLQRVEVLRGPQGTLFGTATLGGAVNYITNPVRLDTYDARLESSISGMQSSSDVGSSDVGYTVKGAANLPIVTDVLGVRVTAIKRFDPGYVDNIGTGQTDANSHDVENFRLNALWQVNQNVSVNFLSFYDKEKNPDLSFTYPTLGDLKSNTAIPQFFEFETRINNLKVDADLNFATLSLDGALSQKYQRSQNDLTPFFGPDSSFQISAKNRTTSLEARLTSPSGGTFEWLVGVYHGVQYEDYPGKLYAQGSFLFDLSQYYDSKETSAFGEVTYRFSDRWRATLGGRYYDTSLQTKTVVGAQINQSREVGDGFSPKASITFEPSSNFLAYALVSKGYRLGGVNIVPPNPDFPSPTGYGSDSLVNYEIGVRPSWFNQRLALDTTLFFINWTDIQLRLARPDGYGYASNAGGAHNFGVENTLNWKATPNLQFQLSATFLQAEISKTTDLGGGRVLQKGARLPGAPRWSGSGLATYHWNIENRPYVTASARFVSDAQSNFGTNTPSLPIMDYSILDLRAGFSVKQYDFSVYVNNIANRRGATTAYYNGAGPSASDPSLERIVYIQPRTVGLRIEWNL